MLTADRVPKKFSKTDQSLCERNEKQGFPNRGTLVF